MQEKRGILGGEKDNMVKSQPKKGCKYINVKLHTYEIQALAIAAADKWIEYKKNYNHPLHNKTSLDNQIIKNWKNLSEKLFSIYRINK